MAKKIMASMTADQMRDRVASERALASAEMDTVRLATESPFTPDVESHVYRPRTRDGRFGRARR